MDVMAVVVEVEVEVEVAVVVSVCGSFVDISPGSRLLDSVGTKPPLICKVRQEKDVVMGHSH